MLNNNLILSSPGHPDLRLRTITKNDIENLRSWKNENKTSFFLNQDITPEQQEKWYGNFITLEHDYMFIIEQNVGKEWSAIGCMGFRKLENEGCIDAYNIIRARKIEPCSFTMTDAFGIMLTYAASLFPGLPVRVKVLTNNPAVGWYQKNHFSIVTVVNDYNLMELEKDSLKNIDVLINKTI